MILISLLVSDFQIFAKAVPSRYRAVLGPTEQFSKLCVSLLISTKISSNQSNIKYFSSGTSEKFKFRSKVAEFAVFSKLKSLFLRIY